MSLSLAIDQGTHASRVILYHANGKIIDSEWKSVELKRLKNGYIEQDANEILRSIEVCIELLLKKIPTAQRQQITQCGLATQRSTLVPCDASGKPIGAAISWQDTRAADFIETLQDQKQPIQYISGLPLSAHYGASKMHWLLDQYHDKQTRSDLRLLPLSSFLIKHLTCSDTFVVDPANAQRTQLMDVRSFDWSQELLDLYAIPKRVLPECVASCQDFGPLLDTGIPVTAVNGDQNAALYAAGEPEANTAYINLGSGGFVLYPTQRVQLQAPLLTSIGYTDADADSLLQSQSSHFFLEGTVNGAGNALNWIKEQYPKDDWWEQLPQWLEGITEPPIFINSIGNIGSPWWYTDVEPTFINTNEANSIEHRAVAVVESILFLVMNNLDLMREANTIQQLYLSGGVSRMDGLCQKLANLSQLSITRFEARETTAKGIAWLAHRERPVWAHKIDRVFSPQMDAGLMERYQLFTRYLENQYRTV